MKLKGRALFKYLERSRKALSLSLSLSRILNLSKDYRKPVVYVVLALLISGVFLNIPSVQKVQAVSPWYDTDWLYRKAITISNTNVDSDLSNFPLLVKIAETGGSPTNIGNNISDATNGYDIRFTDSSGTTLLPYERESFSVDSSNLTANIWVKVPVITTANTTIVYIYYGNSSQTSSDWTAGMGSGNCSTITQAQCVWKEGASQNFKGVWHNQDGTINDYGTSISGYGDSIMAGGNASDAAHRFLNLVAGNYKILPDSWSVNNQGVAAKEIADIAYNQVYPDVVTSTGKSITLLGYNDMRHWGTDANGQAWFQKILYATATWLSIPQANKITGQGAGITYSGDWTNTPVYGGGLGKYTSTTNDYAEFTIHGTVAYIGLTAISNVAGGNYKIQIDGVDQAAGASYGVAAPNSGPTNAPFVVRIGGLSDADHTVKVMNTGGDSPNQLFFDWAAGNENTTNFFLGNTLHMNATGYTLGGAGWMNGSDTAVSQFNAIISNVASTLLGDGLKVQYVDVDSLYNLSTDVATDNVHPNDSGHQHISDAFITAINISTLTQGLPSAAVSDSAANVLSGAKKGTDEPIAAEGKIGTAQQFDGLNDYINLNNNSILDFTSSEFSLSGWVKITNTATPQQLFSRGAYQSNGYYLQLNLSQLAFTTNQTSASQSTISATNPFPNNTWAHIFVSRNGATAKIYVNGVEVTYSAQGIHLNPLTNTRNAYMGIYEGQTLLPLGGLMDEWRVSSTTRSSDWIKFEYYNESSATSELAFADQEAAPSTTTLITSFNFTSPSVTGTINNTNHTVTLTVPYGTNVTNLTPTIAVSTGATISPTSGTSENFTTPVVYTVTAQDAATQQAYTVTVTVDAGFSPAPTVSSTPASSTSTPTESSTTGTAQSYLSTLFAYFIVPPSHAFDSPFAFDASGSYSISGIVKYLWDFGDGTTSEEMKVDHQYKTPGSFTVTLTVTDKTGKTATQSQVVDAKPPAPTVESITADGTNLVFKGKSYPKTIVHLDIHSNPLTVQATADEKSEWVYKMADATNTLDKGDHIVLAKASFVLADKTELASEPSKTYDFKVSLDDGKLKVEMGKTKTWKTVSIILGAIIIGIAGFVLYRGKRRRR